MNNSISEAPLSPPSSWSFLPCGDSALTIKIDNFITPATSRCVLAYDRAIQNACAQGRLPGLNEVVPCYTSLTVHYDCRMITFANLAERLRQVLAQADTADIVGRRWRVPAFYGPEFGDDLEMISRELDMSVDNIIARHVNGHFQIAMIGFTPGFAYLSGLDPALSIPRRVSPRPFAPAGSLSIAAGQAAIQCLASPTGWHVVGRTPVRNFDPHRSPVFLFEPGDIIHFFATDQAMWQEMESAAKAGEIIAELMPSDELVVSNEQPHHE